MDLQKAIYLNTLPTGEVERKERVVSSYAAGRKRGGLRFCMKRTGKVRIVMDYRTLTEVTTLLLDAKPIIATSRPYAEILLELERGEHLIDAVSPASNGGLTLSAEGVGVVRNGPYFDRVGGCVTPDGCIVYLKRGNGKLEKWVYDGSAFTYTTRQEYFYDEAYRYDHSLSDYTSTRRACTGSLSSFTVSSGVSTTFSYSNIGGLAMCDGRTLSTGADYVVGFVDRVSALRFMRVVDGSAVSSSDVSDPIADARRVVSAGRGSILLAEGTDLGWTAYWFHPQGEHTILFGTNEQHYDVIPIGKTGGCCPTATVDADGAPILYFRREDGRLLRCGPKDSVPKKVAYAEAYQPTASSGLLQVDGELSPYSI